MRKLLLTLAAIITMNSSAYAFDEWTTTDTILQSTYSALHIMDWGQTRTTSNSKGRFRETNPILGEHPHRDRVDAYFLSTLVLHGLISYVLPKDYRHLWQSVGIVIETGVVVKNYEVGIAVKF